MPANKQRDAGLPARLLQESTRTMRILAHPLRIRILERLARGPSPQPVGHLVRQLHQPQHTVSHHLNLLWMHGILARRRHGRQIFYRVRDQQALKLLEWVRHYRREEAGFQDGEAI